MGRRIEEVRGGGVGDMEIEGTERGLPVFRF